MVLAALILVFVPAAHAQSFALVSPTGDTLVRELATDLASFQWTPLAGATNYTLSVFQVSNNPRDLGTAFTQSVGTGACSATLCVYAPTGPQLAAIDRGELAWTVVAATPGGDVEAHNAPNFFSYEPNDIALLANPGFETGVLDPWKPSGLAGDKLQATGGNGGTYGFRFKGSSTENASLKQTVNVAYYNIGAGDSLFFTADYKATSAGVQGKFQVKIDYVDSGLADDKVALNASQNPSYVTTSTTIFPDGLVKKFVVTIKHTSPGGKFTVDNIWLVLNGIP
jgi:hypothetical protein